MPRIVCIFLVLLAPLSTQAVTLRYAIVVGNNHGIDETGQQPFSDLRHAEREAQLLSERLVSLANFDQERTVLLMGASRAELRQAFEKLVKQKTLDLEQVPSADTLFALFFTGHGLRGRLLLEDGPLTSEELGQLFTSVGADFNLGFFDACFSGSLDEAALAKKGVRSAPGLNLFEKLPEEVLTAEGSMWFVSSGPTQASYEDRELGGVFTHFFIEALKSGRRDGPGITLDSIWRHVRARTVEYTTARGRRQVPQQFVASLKSTGPFYFSFPAARNAYLDLAASVHGRFILTYADGQFTEMINKTAGSRLRTAVYPGQARLMLVDQGGVRAQKSFRLVADQPVLVRGPKDLTPSRQLGRNHRTLWQKGFEEQALVASTPMPGWSWLMGASYSFAMGSAGLLIPQHRSFLSLRLQRDLLHLGFDVGYGHRQENFSGFSYRADGLLGGLRAGVGWYLWRLQWALTAGVLAGYQWQRFDDDSRTTKPFVQPTAWLDLMLPLGDVVHLGVGFSFGAAYLTGVGKSSGFTWRIQGGVGIGFMAAF